MYAATKANVRTATAAQPMAHPSALTVAFFGGSIMGLSVAALGLIGLGGALLSSSAATRIRSKASAWAARRRSVRRVGGGIFTKAADVGADLVGKVEAGIPEDDPRNPAVIADNVGDNVGDVAGMGADLFESYCGAMIASIAIASTLSVHPTPDVRRSPMRQRLPIFRVRMMCLPLALASIGLIASIAMIFVVKSRSSAEASLGAAYGNDSARRILFLAAAAC